MQFNFNGDFKYTIFMTIFFTPSVSGPDKAFNIARSPMSRTGNQKIILYKSIKILTIQKQF